MKLNLLIFFFFFFENPLKDFPFYSPILLTYKHDVQAMLLQSDSVSEIHFLAICRPRKIFPFNPHHEGTKQLVKKLNLLQKTALDKSAWIKACLILKLTV